MFNLKLFIMLCLAGFSANAYAGKSTPDSEVGSEEDGTPPGCGGGCDNACNSSLNTASAMCAALAAAETQYLMLQGSPGMCYSDYDGSCTTDNCGCLVFDLSKSVCNIYCFGEEEDLAQFSEILDWLQEAAAEILDPENWGVEPIEDEYYWDTLEYDGDCDDIPDGIDPNWNDGPCADMEEPPWYGGPPVPN